MTTTDKAAKSTRGKKNHYDAIVMGANLTGLILANLLTRQDKKVLLLEAKDVVGGHLAKVETHLGPLPSHLNLVPDNEDNRSLLTWLGEILEKDLIVGTQAQEPKTFSEGHLHRFLGFGNRPGDSLDELSFYNVVDALELTATPSQWVEQLTEMYTGELLLKSEVTDIFIENENVTGVMINGSKKFTAEDYIFCLSPKDLLNLADPFEAITPKVRHKVSKAHFWTQVSLHYTHPELITEDLNVHFLMGNKPDHDPCVGRFFAGRHGASSSDPTADVGVSQDSCWMSYMFSEKAEDDDEIGGVIRYMKKQIKRAYPDLFEKISNEKITVHRESHGELFLKLNHPGRLPKIKNFVLATPYLLESRNVPAHIEMAQAAYMEYWQKKPEAPSIEAEATI